jgi:hypothetical protein
MSEYILITRQTAKYIARRIGSRTALAPQSATWFGRCAFSPESVLISIRVASKDDRF